ncbi:MAG: PAAR domain-containing protein [Synergistaceae bacterium]|nr:PAAR domain-containing protein [Synergistaceae bacterium]
MPAVTRKGDSCTGHSCWPSRNSTEGSPDVYVNGIPAHRQGDSWETHCCTHPDCPHGCHSGSLSSGSSTVYVNGQQLGRVGDPVSCGSTVASGSGNVFAGG